MKRVSLIGKGKSEPAPAVGGGVNTFFSHKAPVQAQAKKKKLLFSLPVDVAEKLSDVYYELKKARKTIDKSDIVTLALTTLLEDFKSKKEHSILYKHSSR
ncbi:MAG TPA: hypothetical protein DER10_01810 [Elusimicrobia bacterium]|nr:hypothetical protein [Elusimicrobiota bacterium]